MPNVLLNNRYQILETLGRGGFGETFLAIDTHMPSGRRCVIKLLKPILESPEIPQWLQERFQREAATLEELGENHPQIPRLYAYFTEGGNFYLVQEWIEGLTLTQQYDRQGNFSTGQVERLLLDLLPVLKFIHQRRIIHRDIKPDNIIIRQTDNKPILIDFGVIKETMGTLVNPDGKSAYSVALGTPGYMASEQAAGRPVFSSDLYSLGLTAIFLLTGKTPQYLESDPNNGEILWRTFAPQVTPALADILDRCIRFHPRDRFPTAKEALIALTRAQTVMTAATQVVRAPASRPERTSLYPSTKTTAADSEEAPAWLTWFVLPLLFGIMVLGGLSAGFFFASQRRRTPPPTPFPIESPTPVIEMTPEVFSSPSETPLPAFTPRVPSPRRTPNPRPTANFSPPPLVTTPIPELSPTLNPSPEQEPIPSPTIVLSPSPDNFPPEPTLAPSPSPTVVPTEPAVVPPLSPPAPPVLEKPNN
jgi:serine/threonine-protein kinase